MIVRWLAGVSLLSCAAVGCGGPQVEPSSARASACADFELDVEKTWSAGIKAEVLGHGGEVEAKERKSIVTKLDQLSDDWVRLRTSTCRDHFDRKMIDAETYRKRVKCFDDRLDEQRRIVAAARASDLATAQKLAETASGISNACK